MEFLSRGQALNGGNPSAFKLRNQHQTGESAFSIDQNGADATFSFAAALLGSCEIQILPQ
jgi:hypothetical protein